MDEAERKMHLAAGRTYGRDSTCGLAAKPKVDYQREESAAKAAASMNARPEASRKLEPYPCAWCGGWHIGRAMTDQERNRFLRHS